MERWLIIPKWDNYEVSNTGKVRRIPGYDRLGRRVKGGILKQVPEKNDRTGNYRPYFVTLSMDGKQKKYKVAYLVLFTFKGLPSAMSDNCVRHLDDNQSNNSIDNLEWGSHKDNARDRVRNGKSCPGELNGNRIIDNKAVQEIRSKYKKGSREYSLKSLAELYGISVPTVWQIVNNITWRHI